MARANLIVDAQLRDAFVNAHEARWLSVSIEGERLVHTATGDSGTDGLQGGTSYAVMMIIFRPCIHDSPSLIFFLPVLLLCVTDFDAIVAAIAQNAVTSALYLVRNDEGRWFPLLYIPEEADVRDKMLYAAATQDLKVSLGGLGDAIFQANCVADVTFEGFAAIFTRSAAQPLSEAEVLAKQERQASKQAATAVQSSAMGTVPFQLEADVAPAVEQLVGGTTNWVEFVFDPEKETVRKGRCATLPADAQCSSILDADEPRFYALSRPGGAYVFVYSCPESAKLKLKMCYSYVGGSVGVFFFFSKTMG